MISAGLGVFIVDQHGAILGADEALEQLTGWPSSEIVGRDSTHPLYDGEIVPGAITGSCQLTLGCSNGRTLHVEVEALPLEDDSGRTRIAVRRILSRSASEALGALDAVDETTGLPPRDRFLEQLKMDAEAARDSARPLALIRIDVDRLRKLSERHGRDESARLLRQLADILRVHANDEQRLCRLEEDDFAILLPGSGRGAARQLAGKIRSAIAAFPFFPNDRVTASIGVASYPADADNADQLMERAEEALNEARLMGRNRVWCYLQRPRVPLEVPVFFDATESPLVGYTSDLSPSGIFVQTESPIEVGMRCAFSFPLPGREGKVRVIGRIVRNASEGDFRGMGVEFEHFGGHSDRRAIESWIHRHEHLSKRPERKLTIPD